MLKCRNCGEILSTNDNYCSNCGFSIKDQNTEEFQVSSDDLVKTVKKLINKKLK